MTTVRDLDALLSSLAPVLRPEAYVFVCLDEADADGVTCAASVREAEGVSLVVTRHTADLAGWDYGFVAAWITLSVNSDLAAVGLTAAVASALAERSIGCNVIAGFHHDHLLVPFDRKDEALAVLRLLADRH
ncbi:MAG: ACT domain-containing protein [Propionicimonas sp.]